jgi:hypothetical protein
MFDSRRGSLRERESCACHPTFNLRQTSASTLTGTFVGDLRFNGLVVATFTGPILSGTR